jgi:hypothetical protein
MSLTRRKMKKILNRPIRGEKGQALLITLILLLVGGLIIAPLLGYMSTGLKAGQSNENLMQRLYAADAGVEDAIWRIRNDYSLPADVGHTVTYPITGGVNNKSVTVTIIKEDDFESFVEDLLKAAIDWKSELHFDPPSGHDVWMTYSENLTPGTYTLTMTYSENASANQKWLKVVAIWFEGEYDIVGSASGDMVDQKGTPVVYPAPTKWPSGGGTAFIWEWENESDRPFFEKKPGGDQHSMTFNFTPPQVDGLYFPWVISGSADVGTIGATFTLGVYKVTATATDNTTGKQTEVISYVARMGAVPAPARVLTWEVSLK